MYETDSWNMCLFRTRLLFEYSEFASYGTSVSTFFTLLLNSLLTFSKILFFVVFNVYRLSQIDNSDRCSLL